MILVKAAPVLTSQLEEAVCVAGVTLDSKRRWIRLHPVPFRDLDASSQFQKYQEISVDVVKPRSDRRPETRVPQVGSIRPGPSLGREHGWSKRRELLETLPRPTMCEILRVNRGGSGPQTPSLAITRTKSLPELEITRRESSQLTQWRERAAVEAGKQSLFDDPTSVKPPLEVMEWRFRYKYHCLDSSCGGHSQTIIDWEAAALWRNVRNRPNWQDLMRQKFVTAMWGRDRETELFVGNMHQRPQNFLVLGVFWPPTNPMQRSFPTQ